MPPCPKTSVSTVCAALGDLKLADPVIAELIRKRKNPAFAARILINEPMSRETSVKFAKEILDRFKVSVSISEELLTPGRRLLWIFSDRIESASIRITKALSFIVSRWSGISTKSSTSRVDLLVPTGIFTSDVFKQEITMLRRVRVVNSDTYGPLPSGVRLTLVSTMEMFRSRRRDVNRTIYIALSRLVHCASSLSSDDQLSSPGFAPISFGGTAHKHIITRQIAPSTDNSPERKTATALAVRAYVPPHDPLIFKHLSPNWQLFVLQETISAAANPGPGAVSSSAVVAQQNSAPT